MTITTTQQSAIKDQHLLSFIFVVLIPEGWMNFKRFTNSLYGANSHGIKKSEEKKEVFFSSSRYHSLKVLGSKFFE